MEVSYLPDAQKHPVWPAIEEMLRPAAKRYGGDVYDNDELVWIAYEGPTVFGAFTTLLCDDEAVIRLGAGTRLMEWIDDSDAAVTEWARRNGASKVTIIGRRGWARFAPRLGWASLPQPDEDGDSVYEKIL